jgi:glucosamine-6-phosphate deaminase
MILFPITAQPISNVPPLEIATKFQNAFLIGNRLLRNLSSWVAMGASLLMTGLPTGSSPEGIYKRLVAFHKKGELSFKNVITFNMDEYVDLPRYIP